MITLLPHLIAKITEASGQASREMRAWMEGVDAALVVPESAFVFVETLDDLPAAVSGVITLEDYYTYYFVTEVDLEGSRLVSGVNTTILGASSENSRIKSTGLTAGNALISSEWTIPIRHITLEALTIFDLDATGNSNQAIDWYGVNLEGSSDIGLIKNYGNFVVASMAFLGASGLTFDGEIGTISFSNTIFSGTDPGTIITLPSTLTVTRRFRITYSSLIAFGTGVGINASTSASIPNEGYILDTCNFSGGGTYLQGIAFDDNKARFIENRGIDNSSTFSGIFMQGNGTATTIGATSTPVKAAGTTTQTALHQKFSHSSNRLTYDGALVRNFKALFTVSLSSGNNNQIGLYIAKNGTEISESMTTITTNAGGRAENGVCQVVTSLESGDYIELFVANDTAATNITVIDMNGIVEPLS